MPTTARKLNLELVNDEEIVVLPVVEVDEPKRLRPASVPFRPTLCGSPFE
jgi:hypothetical protein